MSNPEYDVIVYGATSFVGQLVAEYLNEQYGVDGDVKWAIGGRSADKLRQVQEEYGLQDVATFVGDAGDVAFLENMVQQTRVICSTVGPYALYGNDLVAACSRFGTDYVDLTGETQWIRKMIDNNHASAIASGARIVHSCGFDSIPSDLGVMHLQSIANEKHGEPCTSVNLRVKAMAGKASGGTVASMLNVIEEARKDSKLIRILQNPYALAPEGKRSGIRQPNTNKATFDKDLDGWVAPFVMAAINTRNVHRTNALLDYSYGTEFKYDEAVMTGKGFKGRAKAMGISNGLKGFMAAAALGPTRKLLNKFALPQPGEGPNKKERDTGFYKLWLIGKTASGQEVRTQVTGDKDPGYGSTSKMLGEAAVCLAKDISKDDVKGGMWTPAAAMGEALKARLEANAGLTFTQK